MNSRLKQERLHECRRRCRQEGLPVTVQRRAILEAVLDREDHPTADQVFADVRRRLPRVSRTTVYRVLDTFVHLHLITKACHPGGIARFDANIAQHHHLVCLRCDRIVDIHDEKLDALELPDTRRLGFDITDFRVQLRGVCPACRGIAAQPKRVRQQAGAPPGKMTINRRSLSSQRRKP